MTSFPQPSDENGANDLDEELSDWSVEYSDIIEDRHMEVLMSEARLRNDGSEPSFESNYEYVLENMPESKQVILDEYCWKHGCKISDDIVAENISSDVLTALIIDDDEFVAKEYGFMLTAAGIRVTYAYTADDALRIIKRYGGVFSFIVIDIRMPFGDYLAFYETVGGMKTGICLAMEIVETASSATLIALSNSTDSLDIEWFESREGCFYCQKNQFPPERFLRFIRMKVMKDLSVLKTFIIHGHDKEAALNLKNYLQHKLGFSGAIILREQKSKGKTIIEKLEHYLADADIVFALFTPDDTVTLPKAAKRARQNVVFELGYAMGSFGRESGRIFYLYKEGVEIPSDLGGVVFIDISNGIESAGEEISLELEEWLS